MNLTCSSLLAGISLAILTGSCGGETAAVPAAREMVRSVGDSRKPDGRPAQSPVHGEAAPDPQAQSATPGMGKPQGPTRGRRYALLVGVGEYALLNDLSMPTKDTEDLRRTLENIGFECRVVHDDAQLKPLDVAAIEGELARYALSTEPDDTFLFYFSGHGFSLALGDRNADFVCPRSASPSNPGTSLSIDRVRAILTDPRCKAQHRIVILDACRNVAFGADAAMRSQLVFGDGSFASMDRAGLTVLSSTSPGHVSLEIARGTLDRDGAEISNGLFTHFLMKAVSAAADANMDGQLTFREVGEHVARQMLEFSLANNNRYQIPYWDAALQRSDIVLCSVGGSREGQEHEAYSLVQQAVRMPDRRAIVDFLKTKVLGSYHTDKEFRRAFDKAVAKTLSDGMRTRARIATAEEALLGIVEFCMGVDGADENCVRSLAVEMSPEDLEKRILFLHSVASLAAVDPDAASWVDQLLAPCVRMGVQHQKWTALEAIFSAAAFRKRVACLAELQRSLQRMDAMGRPSDVKRLLTMFGDDGLMPLYADAKSDRRWDLVAAHLALQADDAAGLVGEDRRHQEAEVARELKAIVDAETAAANGLKESLVSLNAVLGEFARKDALAEATKSLLETVRPSLWARLGAAAAAAADKRAVDLMLECRGAALVFACDEAQWQALLDSRRQAWLELSLAALTDHSDGAATDPAHMLQIREFAVDDAGRAKVAARFRARARASIGDPARESAALADLKTAMEFGAARADVIADLFSLPEGRIQGEKLAAASRVLSGFVTACGAGKDLDATCLRLLDEGVKAGDVGVVERLLPLAAETEGVVVLVRNALNQVLESGISGMGWRDMAAFVNAVLERCAAVQPGGTWAPDLRKLKPQPDEPTENQVETLATLVVRCRGLGAGRSQLRESVLQVVAESAMRLYSEPLKVLAADPELGDFAGEDAMEVLRVHLEAGGHPLEELTSFGLRVHAIFSPSDKIRKLFPRKQFDGWIDAVVKRVELDRAESLLKDAEAMGIVSGDSARGKWTEIVLRTAPGAAALGARIEKLRSLHEDRMLPKAVAGIAFAHYRSKREWDSAHALLPMLDASVPKADIDLVRDVVDMRGRFARLVENRSRVKLLLPIEKRATSARNNRRTVLRAHLDVDALDGFAFRGALQEELRSKCSVQGSIGELLSLRTDGRSDLSLTADEFAMSVARMAKGIKVLRATPTRDGELQVQLTIALPDDEVVPLDCFPCSSPSFKRAVRHGDDVLLMPDGKEFEWPLVVDDKLPLVFALGEFPVQGEWELTAELHLDPGLVPKSLENWSAGQSRALAKDPNSERKAVLSILFGNGAKQVVALPLDGKPMVIRVPVPKGAGSLTLQGSGDWPGRNFLVLESARCVRKT